MEKTKAIKKFEDYKPVQLSLFEVPFKSDNYSNTIELYDAVPKYFWGRLPRWKKEEGTKKLYLDPLERTFEFRGTQYSVTITPARIKTKEGTKDFYPQEREEIIEDALRKMAYDGKGCFLEDQAAVVFTLYQLRNELKQIGHTYSFNEIIEALQICNQTHLRIMTADGKKILGENMFVTVGLQTKEDWKGSGKKSKCFVRFNSLVTSSIKHKTFRQLNYEKCMQYRRALARWFHKRMSHMFIQASMNTNYTIGLFTILRDSGMKRYDKISNNIRNIEIALKEMVDSDVLLKYSIEKIKSCGRIVDAKFTLYPSFSFVKDMKEANKILQLIRMKASS